MKKMMLSSLVILLAFTSQSYAGIFSKVLSPAFKGQLTNNTSVPSEDIQIRLIMGCRESFMGMPKVCDGHDETETILVPVSKTGSFNFPEIKKEGFNQHVETSVSLIIGDGFNANDPVWDTNKVYRYEYSYSNGTELGRFGYDSSESKDYSDLVETLKSVSLEGFAPSNLMELTIKGHPLAEVLKVSTGVYFQFDLFIDDQNGWTVSASKADAGFNTDGSYYADRRVSKKPETPPFLFAHAGRPFNKFNFEFRVSGQYTAPDGRVGKLDFTTQLKGVSALKKGQGLVGWPYDIQVLN